MAYGILTSSSNEEKNESSEWTACLSAVQMYRPYHKLEQSDYAKVDFLRAMFEAGFGVYTIPGFPHFDMVLSLCFRKEKVHGERAPDKKVLDQFVPVFVSVKAHKTLAVAASLDLMAAYHETLSENAKDGASALGLLVQPALEHNSKYFKSLLLSSQDIALARHSVVVRLVVIPDDDPFGVKKMVKESTVICPGDRRMLHSLPCGRYGLTGDLPL